MAEERSSYDKVDQPKDRFGGWEAREVDPRRSEDNEPQSGPEENDYRRPPLRTSGCLAKPERHRDLRIKTPGSASQPRLSTNDVPSGTGDGLQNGDADECKNSHVVESQGHPLSSASGSATSSSIDGPSRVSSPPSPISPTDVSKPTVRFSDRGPPRAFAKRPPMPRRSGAIITPMAEWGVLFDERGYATLRCSQFLKGLAKHIIDDLAPGSSSLVITPEKLSTFYSRYRIDQEVYFFIDIFNSRTRDVNERIGDFFTDLDCQYHLVQLDSYSRPRVPALTPLGFAQYLTTCILAYPDEEFRRLSKVVADVQLVASADGQFERLPRQLLRSQLPVRHDPKSRKILEAALDDLMYDLRLLGPDSPRTPAPLALMPPPPPPPPISERRGSGSGSGSAVWHYPPPEKPLSGKEPAYARPEPSKLRARYTPTSALQTIGDETASASTPTSAAEAFESMNRCLRRNSYHERYTVNDEPRVVKAAPTTTTRTYRTTAYTPTPTGSTTPTYRRAQSPPLRTYRASAPDVSGSGSGGFKPAGYLPAPAERRASTSTAAEHAASLGGGGGGESCSRRGSVVSAGTPSSTAMALVPVSGSDSQQYGGGGRRTAYTAPPSPAPEKKHHSHRRRRSAVVMVDEDRGPTWEEVLKAQPLVLQNRRLGSSGKGSGGHHHRHHSGY
ncbi:uncharacterized protein GGS22DRAFT_195783 [Annulohypoxylon maeteangense]|uniref:uncharacterized protein n=1 Tax=Annulohypoxylon maeteangense TaxID=1927788 RepID=UPI0020078C35|nr:uncharacterized protein GGS22DRAFT_195783 [Annulohypoxylon maeteangense]KAI0882526.1 hypothetical protein GGS22DRAFT_195783 [Annulohypoxylon maeteangense]